MKKRDFIVQDLLSKIYQRRFSEGKLPTQRDLATLYHVSRYTIQQVLSDLEDIGVIKMVQGSGIFIQDKLKKNPLIFNSLTKTPYRRIDSKVIEFKRRSATPDEERIFQMKSDIWDFTRLRYVNYKAEQLERSCLPVRLFLDLTPQLVEQSIQDYVEKKGYKLSHNLTSYSPAIVNKEEAQILLCKKGTPAMKISNRVFLRDGSIIETSEILAIDYTVSYIRPFDREIHQERLK